MTTTPPVQANRLPAPHDITAAQLRVDAIEVRGVSFRGSAHELFAEPRQDSFACTSNNDSVVLVVSDGIGSCEHSHHGSTAAVNAITTAVESGTLDPEDGPAVLAAAADAATEVATTLDVSSNAVSATLTVAAIERAAQPDGSRHAIIHVVGDSPALLLNPSDSTWTYLTPTEDGPSNLVRSWVPDRASAYISFGVTIPPACVLVLASDGFTIPLGDGTGPLGADLASRWADAARNLIAFLVDLSFNAYHDDKTILALWNPAAQTSTNDIVEPRSDEDDTDV